MSWLARRIGVAVLYLWLAASVIILAARLVPGAPAILLSIHPGTASAPAIIGAMQDQAALNRPILQQYIGSFAQLLNGELGRSLRDGSSVSDEISLRLPRTLELIAAATVLALLAIPGGILTALASGRPRDFIRPVPMCVAGAVLVFVLANVLGLVPTGDYVPFDEDPLRHAALLAAPTLILTFAIAAVMFNLTRTSTVEISRHAFVRTARAKGLTSQHILLRHIARNAIIPIAAGIASRLGLLFGFAAIAEGLFNYPGLLHLLAEAVRSGDFPMVQGVLLVIVALFVVLKLSVDLLSVALDPRLRTA